MRPKIVQYEITFYADTPFNVEGAIFYDTVSDTYITSIEVVTEKQRLELWCADYIDFEYAKTAIHDKYVKTINKMQRRLRNEKDNEEKNGQEYEKGNQKG